MENMPAEDVIAACMAAGACEIPLAEAVHQQNERRHDLLLLRREKFRLADGKQASV